MVDRRVVTYLMSNPPYLHYLVVSLMTLREYYDGDIEVVAYPQSFELVNKIAEDPDLRIKPCFWEPSWTKKNSQFINKIQVCQVKNCSSRVYLDADTTIHGPIDLLFERAEQYGMCITQFNQWLSNSRIIRQRVERLLAYPEINKQAILEVLHLSCPSPNGGIFSCVPDSPVLPIWQQWSYAARDIFICDEAVLHILPRVFPTDMLHVELGGRFNCSHKWDDQVSDPIIYHYHGNSCTRPDKSPRACEAWFRQYARALDLNVGNIQRWRHEAVNPYMQALKEHPKYGRFIKS